MEEVRDESFDRDCVNASGSRDKVSTFQHSCSNLIVRLLLKIPSPSWGFIGYRFPALCGLLSYAVLPVLVLFAFPITTLWLLMSNVFPLNYVMAVTFLMPLIMVNLSERTKVFINFWSMKASNGYKHNPNAMNEYIKLITSLDADSIKA